MPSHCIHRIFVVVFIITCCFIVSPAIAQEEKQAVMTLDTIYVTDRPIIEGNRTDEYGSV